MRKFGQTVIAGKKRGARIGTRPRETIECVHPMVHGFDPVGLRETTGRERGAGSGDDSADGPLGLKWIKSLNGDVGDYQ